MKRKLLAWLLVLCLAVSLLPTAAFATEGEPTATTPWKVASNTYATFEEALEAISTTGTITLTNGVDITSAITIPTGKDVTLDLNGCTISAAETVNCAILNNGTLTIQDSSEGKSGRITATQGKGKCVGVGGNSSTTILSGNFESKEGCVITGTAVGATINISGGKFTANDNAVIAGNGSDREGNGNTINISGGTFNGYIDSEGYIACGVYAPWKDTVTITGGVFNIEDGAGVVARAGVVTIKAAEDGTTPVFNLSTTKGNENKTGKVGDSQSALPCAAFVYDENASYPAQNDEAIITVENATVNAAKTAAVIAQNSTKSKGRIVIGGGTFKDIATAFDHVDRGTEETITIKLNADVNTPITVPETNGAFTLDLNGHNITATTGHAIENKGDLTIAGTGTVTAQGASYAAIENAGSVVINGGTYVSSGWYVIDNHGTMEIDGNVTVQKPEGSTDTSSLIRNLGTDNEHTASLTIESGNFNGKSGQKSCSVVKNDDFGILTIDGGTFDSTANDNNKNATTILNWNEATITDGTFTGSYPVSNGVYKGANYTTTGTIKISGGTFTGTKSLFGRGDDAEKDAGSVTITGGTFKAPAVFDPDKGTTLPYTLTVQGGEFTGEAKPTPATGYAYNGNKVDRKYDVTVATATNGTVTVDKETAFAGDTVTITAKPSDGYAVDAITVKDATVTDNKFTMPASDVTVTVTFKEKEYTVTFDSNGGSKVEPQTVKHGHKANKAVSAKAGYSLEGWYNGATAWDFEKPVTDDITLTAKWVKNVEVKVDEETKVNVNVDEKTEGKVDNDAITGEDNQANAQVVADNTTVTGVTEAVKTEAVTSIVNDAVAKSNEGKAENAQTKLQSTSQVKVDVSVNVEVTQSDLENGTLTFTAEPVATVSVDGTTLKDKDGKDVQVPVANDMLDQTKGIQVKIKLPVNFDLKQIKHIAKDGSVEYFWAQPKTGEKGFEIKSEGSDKYAVFTISHFSTFELKGETKVEYTITWDYQSYGKTVTETYLAGQDIKKPENPTKAGNTFLGWEGLEENKKATKNVTFTAKWKAQAFEDVVGEKFSYAADAVEWATKNGITNGMVYFDRENCFGPDENCTRAQLVTFLWRAAGCPEPAATTTQLTDLDEDEYYYKAVLWAVEKGIVKGYPDKTFKPNAACERCEAMCFLYRFALVNAQDGNTSGENETFTDLNEDWYMNAVKWATDKGVTKGMDETHFGPEVTCSRAHFVTFLWRIVTGSELVGGNSAMENTWANWTVR